MKSGRLCGVGCFRIRGNLNSFFFFKDSIYLFLERGEGRQEEGERNIDVRENIDQLVAPHALNGGPGLQPRHVP